MKIQFKARLKLQKVVNTLIIRYNTFEKVTWDQFLLTSVSLHAKDGQEAQKFIEEVAGNGSLNSHFKNLYEETNQLTLDEKKRVLDSNLYPVLKIDSSNRYEYYPDLGISVLSGKIYHKDITNDTNLHKMLILDKNATYHSSDVTIGTTKDESNVYTTLIDNDEIKIELTKSGLVKVDESTFKKHIQTEVSEIDNYEGTIYDNPSGSNWSLLTNSLLNNLNTAHTSFYQNGDYHMITNEGMKIVKIGSVYGVYIYNERHISYSKENKELCQRALTELLNTSNINTFKTKPLVQILQVVSKDLAQEAINYVLNRKNSAEIAQVGLELLANGYEKNWNLEVLNSLKSIAVKSSDLVNLYKAAPTLDYDIKELIQIHNLDKNILRDTHKNNIVVHYQNEDKIRMRCAERLGVINQSAIRERSKILRNSSKVELFRKLINKYSAHNTKDINNFTGDRLLQYDKEIESFYNLYLEILDLVTETEVKN